MFDKKIMFPTGTVTFVFTDLENSTRLWEEFPVAMKQALAQHDAILHEAVRAGDGLLIKTTGDGIHAVFAAAADGIKCVIAAQLALKAEPWAETGRLRVRMGLHTGEAAFRDGDYYGSTVNRAARIMGTAAGDQILISGSTANLIRDNLPPGVSLKDLGEHYLRGLQRPARLFQLLHPDLPREFPALKTTGTIPNNLPAQMTSFVGREQELADVQTLLARGQPEQRLVTLTGTGGTGKTRLALKTAEDLLDQFPHGVWLVELAPVIDPERVIQAVASPMGIREQGARPLELMVIDHLRNQKALLILDNCEHLIDECARVAGLLLRSCPQLHVLASSREALGIGGERPYQVRSLAMPPADRFMPPESLIQYEAVHLFVERAQEVRADFKLDSHNAVDIVEVCRRLDGIPLALELAAARVRVLTPKQIGERLDNRFRLLTGGRRTALPRQRTLQALIDWSYDLLPEAERIMLGRLSVFSNGWSLEAAEAMVGFEPLELFEVLDTLEQLVNKSLVVVEEQEYGMRYRLLESIRQYAQEKLAQSTISDKMYDRHLGYFLTMSLEAHENLMELRPAGDWIPRFAADVDNFRAAWDWALETDVHALLQFAYSFTPAWNPIVPLVELHRVQKAALELAQESPDFTGAEAVWDNRVLLTWAIGGAVNVAVNARLMSVAFEYAQLGMQMAEEMNDLATYAALYSTSLMVSALTKGMEAVQTWLDEAFDLVMRHGRPYTRSLNLVIWGTFNFFATGQYPQLARERWEQGMAMLREGDALWTQGRALQITADLSRMRNDPGNARRLVQEVFEIYEALGDNYAANPANSLLADLARQEGNLSEAAALYRKTLRVWHDSGRVDAGARTIECIAYVTRAQASDGDPEERQLQLAYAAALLGAASAIRQSNKLAMSFVDQPVHEQELAAVRDELGAESFEKAWRKGQALDLNEAVILATEETSLPLS